MHNSTNQYHISKYTDTKNNNTNSHRSYSTLEMTDQRSDEGSPQNNNQKIYFSKRVLSLKPDTIS